MWSDLNKLNLIEKIWMWKIMFQITKKKRIHFNSFMTNVHARIHEVKEEESKNQQYVGSDKANPFDPTRPVADMITRETWLLCFDEFQVNINSMNRQMFENEFCYNFRSVTKMNLLSNFKGSWHRRRNDSQEIIYASVRPRNCYGGNK